MRSALARAVICFAALSGIFGACFEPPLLEPISRRNAAGAPASDAGEGPSSNGGEPSRGGDGGSKSGSAGSGAAGGGAGGGAGGAGGGAGTSPSVAWLELEGDLAPSSAAVNAELGIQGSFYAYGDECASLIWDETTRCASGQLCDTGPSFENWGVAVGFDFNNTGIDGEPPNTKLLWDPRERGVRGFAWRVTGRAPGLQVWVLNMDPSFGDACSAQTCEILGPPDGTDVAPLAGQLLLSNMRKDDWGSGVAYDFDPARVHALQIKLPAVRLNANSFDFCVEAIGVIR